MKKTRSGKLLVTAALVLALFLAANPAQANVISSLPDTYPTSQTYGKTYADWGAEWWKWVVLSKPDKHPLLDRTGEFAHVNQSVSGFVFFLGGTWTTDSVPVVRNVTVKSNQALFFPTYNWVNSYPEDVDPAYRHSIGQAEQYLRNTLNSTFDGIDPDYLVSKVDGTHVQNYRAQSKPFGLYLPADSYAILVDNISYVTGDKFQAGLHDPSISDGYWVLLDPLSVGPHTIKIQAGPSSGRWVDVTYNLSVVPLPSTLLLLGSGVIGLLAIRPRRRS